MRRGRHEAGSAVGRGGAGDEATSRRAGILGELEPRRSPGKAALDAGTKREHHVDIEWMKRREDVMRQFVRGLAWDAASLGAVLSFIVMITLWGEAIGWAGSF